MSIQFSVTTPVQILNNPVNNSSSKFQFSFSKSPRFLSSKKMSDSFYDLPSQKSSRKAGFGVGDRPDFTRSNVQSPPAKYELQSCFDKERSTSRGKSFGTAREKMKEFGIVRKGSLATPGPGTYRNNNVSLNESLSFSMRPKTRDVDCNIFLLFNKFFHQNNKDNPLFLDGHSSVILNPGPGQYEQYEAINKTGKFSLSKYRSSGATTINPSKSKRFPSSSKYTPGPGQYKPLNDLDKSGSYVLSIYKSYGTRNFANSQARKSFVDDSAKNPGPGMYRLPSEFGNYDHLDLNKSSSVRSSRSSSMNKNSVNKQNTASQIDFYASTSSSRK